MSLNPFAPLDHCTVTNTVKTNLISCLRSIVGMHFFDLPPSPSWWRIQVKGNPTMPLPRASTTGKWGWRDGARALRRCYFIILSAAARRVIWDFGSAAAVRRPAEFGGGGAVKECVIDWFHSMSFAVERKLHSVGLSLSLNRLVLSKFWQKVELWPFLVMFCRISGILYPAFAVYVSA